MGNSKDRSRQRRNLIIFTLFLLVSSINHGRSFMAEGRAMEKPTQITENVGDLEEKDEKGLVMRRKLIGSRPPSCEKRCRDCGHCEAVQVPIVPQEFQKERRRRRRSRRRRAESPKKVLEYSRGDDISNYKPLSWKCKCGDFIFNP